MATQAQELAERLRTFNEEVIALVKEVPEANWRKRCEGEQWPVGVVARHIGVGHYGSIELVKMMIAGTPVPDLSEAQIIEFGNAHAAKHADCTKEEVLSILGTKGRKLVDYVGGLSDAELETSAHIDGFGGNISVKRLLKTIILRSAGEHVASMRKASQDHF